MNGSLGGSACEREAKMRRAIVASAVFLVLAGLALLAGSEAKPSPPYNVILVGWDGAGRKNVREGLEAGELPTIERLAGEGALVAIDILRTTDTKAGWTQVLTGYEPERTGVFSNKRYQPIPTGYTLFERLEKHFGRSNVFTAAVIAKDKNMGTGAPRLVPMWKAKSAKHVVVLDGKQFAAYPGKPYFHTHEHVDVFENGLHWDKDVGTRTLELLDQHHDERFFFFVHFGEVDRKGHMFGEGSDRYRDALISADTWTGKILDRLGELGIADETLVYVTADHGFDEGRDKHFDAPHVFLATNDPQVVRRGERADIAPTILTRLGIDPGGITPALDGHTLTEPYTPAIW
jgi:arylsulfatase A-like enzyme